MDESRIITIFKDSGALLTGHFQLSSGLHSDRYLQCALVLQFPKIAEELCRALASRWTAAGIQTVIGPALGGIIVAHELARALGARCLFMERQEGQMTLRRHFTVSPGEKVLLAEDVVTTGVSVKEIIRHMEKENTSVAGVAALVNRSGGNPFGTLRFEPLLVIPPHQFDPKDCPMCKRGEPIYAPGSRRL